jgi:hypothetical protein
MIIWHRVQTRRAAFAVWRVLGCPAEYHPDGPEGYELLGRPVPAALQVPLWGPWRVVRLAAGRTARQIVRGISRAAQCPFNIIRRALDAVQRECFDLRVLWGALTRPSLVWVTAQAELAGLDDEFADIHLVPVSPAQVDEWFGRRRVDGAPSLTRRVTAWLCCRNRPSRWWLSLATPIW